MDHNDAHLARGWLSAAVTPEVVSALEGVYAETAARIAARGPVCWASGRCCNFAKTGHLLYVTGLEGAYAVARMTTALTLEGVGRAEATGGCPFQVGNLCGAHAIRPLGCRVYFCDRTAQEWQQELYEQELAAVRGIHDRFRVEYRYAEWRAVLRMLVAAK